MQKRKGINIMLLSLSFLLVCQFTPLTVGVATQQAAPLTAGATQQIQSIPSIVPKPHPPLAKVAAVNSVSLYGISLGMTPADVTGTLGKPDRIDPSTVGVEWWIFNRDLNHYLQVGVQNNKVVTLFSNGASVKLKGVTIGSAVGELAKNWGKPSQTLAVTPNLKIQENLLNEHPSYLINKQIVTFSLDKVDNSKVAGVRISTPDHFAAIALGLGYPLLYSKLPSLPKLTEDQLDRVAHAYEKENLDLTNIARLRAKLPLLAWNEKLAATARSHSMEMIVRNYFNHNSPTMGSPFDRMEHAGISFVYAGENIAAGQLDGVEVHFSWMNSPGHRRNLLESHYTQIGVGIIVRDGKKMYTQNFISER